MNATDDSHLHDLLTTFDATALGEGDPMAGANLLAAMAFSLAAVARPGSGLRDKNGKTYKVGTSLLVSGSRSTSLITDEVLIELGRRQNNLTSHLRYSLHLLEREKLQHAYQPGASTPGPSQSPEEGFLLKLQKQGALSGLSDHPYQAWATIVEKPARPRFQGLVERSQVYFAGTEPKILSRQLRHCHQGRPILHVGVGQAADFRRFKELCPAILDGRMLVGQPAEQIHGTVILTDPSATLAEAIQIGEQSGAWLGRTVWLFDGGAGPELPELPELPEASKDSKKPPVVLDHMEARFEIAMNLAWAHRLNNHTSGPRIIPSELANYQAQWMEFLGEQEPNFPGITRAARSLFPTLAFGLTELISAEKMPARFTWNYEWVAAFARFLVTRMVNARAAMLWSAHDARIQAFKTSLLQKLEEGPHDTRTLVRRHHRLPTDLCRELLLGLETAGMVTCIEDCWTLTAQKPEALTLGI